MLLERLGPNLDRLAMPLPAVSDAITTTLAQFWRPGEILARLQTRAEPGPRIRAGGWAGRDRDQVGEAHIVDVPAHHFFVGSLFVPQCQTSSTPGRPSPGLLRFAAVRIAAEVAGKGAVSETGPT
jgi:hypothetical protein